MLGLKKEDLIGNDLSTTMPELIIRTILCLADNSCVEDVVELPSGRCHTYITRISATDQNAIVIALLKEP